MPKLDEFYSLNKQNVEIISVSLDTVDSEWRSFITEQKFTWIDICDLKSWDGQIAEKYNLYATPTMFVLDKTKTIVAKPITINELNKDWERINQQ